MRDAANLTDSSMSWYPVHLQRFPESHSLISPSSASGCLWSSSYVVMRNPGVQKPHWRPCFSLNASWIGWRSPLGLARPSTVISSAPSACAASMMQERTVSPFIRIVQAPHTPCSQPTLVPVRPTSSRKKSTKVLRASTVCSYATPFTRNLTVRMVAIRCRLVSAAPRAARAWSTSPRGHGGILLWHEYRWWDRFPAWHFAPPLQRPTPKRTGRLPPLPPP